jgi:hypothetical protein
MQLQAFILNIQPGLEVQNTYFLCSSSRVQQRYALQTPPLRSCRVIDPKQMKVPDRLQANVFPASHVYPAPNDASDAMQCEHVYVREHIHNGILYFCFCSMPLEDVSEDASGSKSWKDFYNGDHPRNQ